MNILGLSLGAVSTAALYSENRIVACASEERFSRLKSDEAFPVEAIRYVMSEAGVEGKDLAAVVIAGHHLNLNTHLMRKFSSWDVSDHMDLMNLYWKPKLLEKKDPVYNDLFRHKMDLEQYPGRTRWERLLASISNDYYSQKDDAAYRAFLHQLVQECAGVELSKIIHLDHHECHAAYAYWGGHLRGPDTLILTADAFGDGLSSTISTVDRNGMITRQHEVPANTFTLGRIYRHMTLLLAMMPDAHEYKVMGLAPYAKESTWRPAYEVFRKTMRVEGIDFKYDQTPSDYFFWFKERLETCRFDGIAGGLQHYAEEILLNYVSGALEQFKCRDLAFSGGISMNIKANMLIKDLPGLRDMAVPPSGSDESLAMGACFAYAHKEGRTDIQPLKDAYLGPVPDPEKTKAVVARAVAAGFSVTPADNALLAKFLKEGKVAGRCVGRMEFGARALGNRSIIADARSRSIVPQINEKIKNRDFWMPFAPSVLEEDADRLLVNPKGLFNAFMTIGFESTALGAEVLAAGTHPSDQTLRPHIVRRSVNPSYHDLITTFKRETGVGGILNTSFNLHGAPIVNGADDAYEVFLQTDIDVLALDSHIIAKKPLQSA